jgi:hypothetical protein
LGTKERSEQIAVVISLTEFRLPNEFPLNGRQDVSLFPDPVERGLDSDPGLVGHRGLVLLGADVAVRRPRHKVSNAHQRGRQGL